MEQARFRKMVTSGTFGGAESSSRVSAGVDQQTFLRSIPPGRLPVPDHCGQPGCRTSGARFNAERHPRGCAKPRGGFPAPWVLAGLILLLALLLPACPAAGQEGPAQDPDKLKAAFLRNFAHYVSWPSTAFAGPQSPWRIGVLGNDSFGSVLERSFRDRTEQGRAFEIHRAEELDKLPPCHIVYIAIRDPDKRHAALAALRDKPVLTVGEEPDFLEDGGIIRLQATDRAQMSINLDQARAVSLAIQTRMLEVSSAVLENGVMRSLR